MSRVVTTIGRFNPPTIGHDLLGKFLIDYTDQNQNYIIYISQKEKEKHNPLPFEWKYKLMGKIYGETHIRQSNGLIPMLKELSSMSYQTIEFIVGSDQIPEMERIFNNYNQKEFYFKDFKVTSCGDRNSEDINISATKVREAARIGDWVLFKSFLSRYINSEERDYIWKEIRKYK
jgi:nicotinic acid mononucleotide adenylyltransferase